MLKIINRTASVIVALIGLYFYLPLGTNPRLAIIIFGYLMILSLIWFGEEISDAYFEASKFGGIINAPSPGWMVAGIAWVLLIVLAIGPYIGTA